MTGRNGFGMPSLLTRPPKFYTADLHKIRFHADRLLHKHPIENDDDKLYLIALPEAPIGEHEISYRSFCSELDDWVDGTMLVKVE